MLAGHCSMSCCVRGMQAAGPANNDRHYSLGHRRWLLVCGKFAKSTCALSLAHLQLMKDVLAAFKHRTRWCLTILLAQQQQAMECDPCARITLLDCIVLETVPFNKSNQQHCHQIPSSYKHQQAQSKNSNLKLHPSFTHVCMYSRQSPTQPHRF